MTATGQAHSTASLPDRLPHVGQSMRTWAIVVITALVALPAMLTGYLTHAEARRILEQSLTRESGIFAQTAGNLLQLSLASRDIDASQASLQTIVDKLALDDQVSFMVVCDPAGRVVAHHYRDPLAYRAYEQQIAPEDRAAALSLNRSIKLHGLDPTVHVIRRHLSHQTTAADARPAIVGYVEIGLQSPSQGPMLIALQNVTFTVVAIVCSLCLPLALWWVRRWTDPLRQIVRSALRLGTGGGHQPLNIHRDDEIGLLANAFNAMAMNLTTIQQALLESHNLLEQKVADRTRQLEQANTRLQREISDKDQFLRAVSHDLGAPLRNIEGLTSLLMLKHRAQFTEDALGKLERIVANVKAETDLINDLMELGRIKSRPGRRIPVDLNEIVRSIAESLSYDLESRQIRLIIDNPLPTVVAERNRMRQVFQNLLDNALKYMPDDAPLRQVHVGLRHDDQTPVIYVRDTGSGIPHADHEAIFQVFRRGRHPRHDQIAGRGIGLASVRAIVECYGGRIWVESEPPHGATFCFTLDSQYLHHAASTTPSTVLPSSAPLPVTVKDRTP
jgi:signal transduction histidine kinase